MSKKVLLMILDGWGIAKDPSVSAIDQAHTPFVDSLYNKYPNSTLEASGMAVGLPEGQMGNSEVGHMNIGAGRVVYQDLVRLNKAVEDGSLNRNPVLLDAIKKANENNSKLHLIGLVSDGGVHSHIDHLKAICSIASDNGVNSLFIHAFTDGRDTDPKSGVGYIRELEEYLKGTGGQVASVTGRYYGMDRDKRWERVKIAYDCLVNGVGVKTSDLSQAMKKSYQDGITDEFIKPIVKEDGNGNHLASIEPGDVVIGFNFRTDRLREFTQVLTQIDLPEFGMKKMPLDYYTMTVYDDSFQNIKVIFKKETVENTLGAIFSGKGKNQIRIAESEKYPHVTFFFSGGREEEFKGEKRILCPSPKVATYDLQPEMSAFDIRDKIMPELESGWADFICLNFANPDMVGHTGVFEAAVKACETVDQCTEAVVTKALENNYTCLIIADHGNSDCLINPDGTPNTTHTTNLVPCILVDNEFNGSIDDGVLGDIAPTILKIMGMEIPEEMTGKCLI